MPPLSFRPFFLSPLFVTLRDHLQLIENPVTLSLFPATLTRHVNHNPFVCHSYKKHPGVDEPDFIKRKIFDLLCSSRGEQPEFRVSNFAFRLQLATRHSPLATKFFTIRTSKTKDLKLFRMNTYEKTPRGVEPNPVLPERKTSKPSERGCNHG